MKITLYNIKKGFKYLKHYGMKEFWIKLRERMEPEEVPYEEWRQNHVLSVQELERQRKDQQNWKQRPLISIAVPAFHTPERFLRQMIESVQQQSYTNWQLCIADGSKDDSVQRIVEEYQSQGADISYQRLVENKGIAENSNAALAMAKGEWIGLLDHDDLLAENALYEVVRALSSDTEIDVVYTDEDKVNTELTQYFQPHFKPDFSLDLLRSNNYITHFFVFRKSLLEKQGGFRKEFDGAQDYDLILRYTEAARKIYHVPAILYHWRIHQASTADNPMSKQYAYDAGQRAIEAHLQRMGIQGMVSQRKDMGFYDVKYPVQGEPLVSIIIPNKDQTESLDKCLQSINKSAYANVEIVIVENNSQESQIFEFYDGIRKGRYTIKYPVKIVTWKEGFNYSAINNFGFSHTKGEYIILLNNDIEIINPEWIEEMLGNCQRQEVGIVGAKLYYPDDTIQHAGIVLGIGEGMANGGVAGAMFVGMKRSYSGYLHKASIQLNYSAVTAACMMVKRAVFEEVGGLEEELAVAFNDIDFCLKVRQAGYLVVYNPRVEAYHYESKSRGKEDSREKVERFHREIEYMRDKWLDLLKNDPYYNKNLSLSRVNYTLKGR